MLLLYGCANSIVTNVNTNRGGCGNLTVVSEDLFSTKTIYVGDKITHKPLASQIVEIDGKEKYMLLDMNSLYIYDWETCALEDSVDLSGCGNLDNYSGFSYKSKDTIYVYNYNKKSLFIADHNGRTRAKTDVAGYSNADFEALNKTRILYGEKGIVMSGGKLGDIGDMKESKTVVSQELTLGGNSAKNIMCYPAIYKNGFWGGVYMNDLSHTIVGDSIILYSFPIDHYVRIYNVANGQKDSLYLGSKYTDAINSCSDNPMELFADKDARIDYYIHEHSYDEILYDNYRNIIVRIASHPLEKMEEDGRFVKPFSIITYNVQSNVLTESQIFKTSSKLNTMNMHICRDGLAIAGLGQKDETKINFRIFKIAE